MEPLNEKLLKDYPSPIFIKGIRKISGFFCKIPLPTKKSYMSLLLIIM